MPFHQMSGKSELVADTEYGHLHSYRSKELRFFQTNFSHYLRAFELRLLRLVSVAVKDAISYVKHSVFCPICCALLLQVIFIVFFKAVLKCSGTTPTV